MRNFSRSSRSATTSAAASQPALEPGVRQLDVDRDVLVEDAVGAGGVHRGDDPAGVAGQVVEVAQRDLEAGQPEAEPGGQRRRHRRSAPAPPVTTTDSRAGVSRSGRQVGVPDDEGADQVGVRRVPPGGVRGHGLGQRRVAGREDRRVVDESGPGGFHGGRTRGYSNHEAA